MEISKPIRPQFVEPESKLSDQFDSLNQLLDELTRKGVPEGVGYKINQDIEKFNSFSGSEKALSKKLISLQSDILKLVEKELHLVVKHHYRNTWMAVGMASFGIPIGLALGLSFGNMGFLAIGLPLGMVIGLAIGSNKDQKAESEGKQLEYELKY